LHERGLAGTGRADESNNLSLYHGEIDVAEDLACSVGVGEVDILKGKSAHCFRVGGVVGLRNLRGLVE